MDWTQYVRTLCRKPGAADHTRFFAVMPLPWQSYLLQTRGQEWRSALQLLYDIVRDGNAEFCVDILTLAQQNGMSDVDSVKQCYYSLLKEGKTPEPHLAAEIALKACQESHRVRFFTAASLANILLERNNKGTLNGFMTSLKKVELIVIDELGFVPLHKDAAQLMFQVISDCYERKSLIITSNLEFSGWNTVLDDNRLTAALIDRLVHHSHIVIFSGESYRLQQSMKRQKTARKK